MILKLSFCFYVIILSTFFSFDDTSSYKIEIDLVQKRGDYGDLADFENKKRKDEREAVTEVNTNFNLQDKIEKICRAANVFRACTTRNVKIGCKHGDLRNVRLSKNGNFSVATPVGYIADFMGHASFRLKTNNDLVKTDCYFCWIQVEGQSPQRSEAVNVSYYDCSEDVERQKISPTLGSSVSLDCWNSNVEINGTIEWYYTDSNEKTLPLNILDGSKKLDINNATNANVGLYHCWIWFDNPKYRYARQFELRILQQPAPPSNVTCSMTDRGLTLKWTQINTPNKVDTYKLQYRRLAEDNAWTEKVLPGNKNEFSMPLYVDRASGRIYVLRLTGVNAAGESKSRVASCYFSE